MADMYLKYGDVKGGATEDGHDGWIVVNGLDLNVSCPAFIDYGAGANAMYAGYPDVEQLKVTVQHDKATTQLVKCLNNKTVTLDVEIDQLNARKAVNLKIKLKNVMVTGIDNLLGDAHQLRLSFTAICFTYNFYGADGSLKDSPKTGFDLEAADEKAW